MTPPLAFGWAIILGFISLILVGFFGLILVGSILTNLGVVYGTARIIIIQSLMAILTTFPLVILINAIYYLFCAHKGYTKWYKDYAKRHHLIIKSAKTTKKTSPVSDDDEDI